MAMSGRREHWYSIEEVLTEVARACEALRARARSPAPARANTWPETQEGGEPTVGSPSRADLLALGGPPGKDQIPASTAVPLRFEEPLDLEAWEASAALGRGIGPAALVFAAEAGVEISRGTPTGPSGSPLGADVVALRSKVRERLLWLKARLGEGLTSREAYFVLFALVVHVDEKVASAAGGGAAEWPPLQLGFFEIDDGGERFYSVLDALLDKEDTLPLILEVFYYCLKDGFLGLYANNPDKIEAYLARLSARLSAEASPLTSRAPQRDSAVRLVELPWHYYLWATGTAASLLLILHLLSRLEAGWL